MRLLFDKHKQHQHKQQISTQENVMNTLPLHSQKILRLALLKNCFLRNAIRRLFIIPKVYICVERKHNNFNDAYRRSGGKNKEINILWISLTQFNFVETHIDSFF